MRIKISEQNYCYKNDADVTNSSHFAIVARRWENWEADKQRESAVEPNFQIKSKNSKCVTKKLLL